MKDDDKVKLIVDRIDDLKEYHGERLDSIDDNLKEHMRRTDVLEQLHRDNQARIEMLEQPRKALKLLKDVAMWSSAVLGAVLIIQKILGNM